MPTSRTSEQISADFDRIAQLPVRDRDHNTHYHKFLLAHLPQQMNSALDVGCGMGEFSRLLTSRTEHVIGIELSPGMIEQAKSKSLSIPNVDFQVADMMVIDFAPDNFDAIVSIATLHHLPLDRVLSRLAAWVKPGGILAILDMARVETTSLLLDGLSMIIDRTHRKLRPSEVA